MRTSQATSTIVIGCTTLHRKLALSESLVLPKPLVLSPALPGPPLPGKRLLCLPRSNKSNKKYRLRFPGNRHCRRCFPGDWYFVPTIWASRFFWGELTMFSTLSAWHLQSSSKRSSTGVKALHVALTEMQGRTKVALPHARSTQKIDLSFLICDVDHSVGDSLVEELLFWFPWAPTHAPLLLLARGTATCMRWWRRATSGPMSTPLSRRSTHIAAAT